MKKIIFLIFGFMMFSTNTLASDIPSAVKEQFR